jgi:hypothetical protein
MRSPKLLVSAVTLTALVALGGAALAANDPAPTAPSSDAARDAASETTAPAVEDEGPGTETAPREDEGPGTETAPREDEGPGTDATPASREVAEPYEGPGTTDGPVHTCLQLDGREVCDTFGESDEGPGTR